MNLSYCRQLQIYFLKIENMPQVSKCIELYILAIYIKNANTFSLFALEKNVSQDKI